MSLAGGAATAVRTAPTATGTVTAMTVTTYRSSRGGKESFGGAAEGDSAALDFLIDFLIYTGIVVEREDGSLAKGEVEADTFARVSATVPVSGAEARAAVGAPTFVTSQKSVSVTVHIHIQRPEQLTQEYADRVKEWLRLLEVDGAKAEVSVDAADHEDLALRG